MLKVFISLSIAALFLAALLTRRHRPQLLTTCLVLSLLLHLLSLSLFSIVHVHPGRAESRGRAAPGSTSTHRIEGGPSVLLESQVSHSLRVEPLKTLTVDAHAQLEPVRAAKREPVKNGSDRVQAAPQESDPRTAGHVDIKNPDILPAQRVRDEPLDAMPTRPIEVSSLPLAALPQAPGLTETAQKQLEKRFDDRPVAPAPLTGPKAKPSAPLETAQQTPAATTIILAPAASRQPEVQDALQPAQTKPPVDRLADHAAQIENPRTLATDDPLNGAKPRTDVNPGKRVGGDAPQPAGKHLAATQPDGKPRMAMDSLATDNPGRIERKKNEVGGFSSPSAVNKGRLEPMRLNDAQPVIVSARTDMSGMDRAPGGKREWASAKEKTGVAGALVPMEGKPQALVQDRTPSQDPVRIGLGGDALPEPVSKTRSVPDGVSDLPSERPGLVALGYTAPTLAPDDQISTPPLTDKMGASTLVAEKLGAGLGGTPGATPRVTSRRFAGTQDARGVSGTLVEGSDGGLHARAAASAEFLEPLTGVAFGTTNSGGQGLSDIGSPVQSVAVVSRGVVSGGESGSQPLSLTLGRTPQLGAPVKAGDVERPSPTGRTDLPVGPDSGVGGDIGGTRLRTVSSSIASGEPLETGGASSVALAVSVPHDLAGQMNLEQPQGEGLLEDEGSGEHNGPAELSPGKAEGGGTADAGILPRRIQTPSGPAGGAPSGPAGSLVVPSDIHSTGRILATGTTAKDSLTAMSTAAGRSDSAGLAISASTVAPSGSSGEVMAKAGIAPARPLSVAKADGGVILSGEGGGRQVDWVTSFDGVGERKPARMDLSLNAGQSKARETVDISVPVPGQEGFHSFLTMGNGPNPDFVPQKAIYKMRKPEKRKQFIQELGGTVQTEEAVEQALVWLSRAQSDDGHWDVDGFKTLKECGGAGDLANEDMFVTGLSLLSYLGAGYTHLDGAHQETVRKALDWLLNCEKENGDFRGSGQMYGQAIATAALCESYSLTGDERLLAPARRAVQFIVNSQTAESGWRYAPRNENDTSVTGWQILALKSAQIAGIAVPDQTFRWTERWLDQVRQGQAGGLYSYKVGHAITPVMTAEGAFCQLFTGEQMKNQRINESTAYLMNNLPTWDPQRHSVHLYYWYYATLAMYLSGTQEFEAWNAALTRALLKGRNTAGPSSGSWDPVCQLGLHGGRIYSTAVGALCLEVYYRFLPLYKQKAW